MTFHIYGNGIIIPIEELHHFSEGLGLNHQPERVKGYSTNLHNKQCVNFQNHPSGVDGGRGRPATWKSMSIQPW